MTEKNPHRCETCKKDKQCPVLIQIRKSGDYSPPLMSYAVLITELAGCASHSDFHPPKKVGWVDVNDEYPE